MNISITKASEAMAIEVWFDPHMMHVRLRDGREIGVPIEWSPKLRSATEKQRKGAVSSVMELEYTGRI